MTKLTGAALDRAVAHAMGLKSVHNCEKWSGAMEREAPAQSAQDGKCKLCVNGCAACDARAQPAQEPVATISITQSGSTRTIDNHFADCVRDWPEGEYKLVLATPPEEQPAQEQWKCVGPPCKCNASNAKQCCYAVFTAPPKRPWVGLTDGEVMEMMGYEKQYGYIPQYSRNFVDAISAKLKEKNNG